jgi:hypothetical protein
MMQATVVADQGTHLLITDGARFAVVERRAGHFNNCHGDSRSATTVDSLAEVEKILDNNDWKDRQTAQTEFDEIVARGNDLAQRML